MATGMDDDGDGRTPRRIRLPAAERRETILRAAAEVFAEAGYRAAKVSDVARRVGVTEPVIFQNFGSKAGLFAAVVERAAAEARASLDDLAAGFGSASGLLAHVLAGSPHGAGADHAAAAYGVLFADATALTAEPALSGPARDAIRAVAAHLADLIRRAQADGEISSGADPEAAAWLLLSVLSARRLRAAAMPDGLEPAVAALTLRAITSPLLASPSTPAREPVNREHLDDDWRSGTHLVPPMAWLARPRHAACADRVHHWGDRRRCPRAVRDVGNGASRGLGRCRAGSAPEHLAGHHQGR
jgi:AcrR family transcriptional regulator